jgi:restriction system protein
MVEQRKRVVVTGPGGIGKTVLARRFAETYDTTSGGRAHWLRIHEEQALLEIDALHPGHRDLVIVDGVRQGALDHILDGLRTTHPDLRALLLSRFAPQGLIDAQLTLDGLSTTTITGLLRRARLPDLEARQAATVIADEMYGHPLIVAVVGDLVARGIPIVQILRDLKPFERAGVVGPASDNPIFAIEAVRDSSNKLFEMVSAEPELMHALTPREFEEIVAELLARRGYDVTLTPFSRDGGKDIYAARRDDLGSFLYVVECKAYAPDQPVGVQWVRQLHGVVQAESATAGVIFSTSTFTGPAREFQRQIRHQMNLQDYHDVSRWLRTSFK